MEAAAAAVQQRSLILRPASRARRLSPFER